MRHLNKTKKFSRKRGQRKAFLKSLVSNLINYEKIITTEARAKEIKKIVERYMSYGRKQNLSGLRLLLKYLPKKSAYKIYNDLVPRYLGKRVSGFVRIVKFSKRRKNDGAKIVKIEFV
jgi:large subunit ribosomal protein L17